MFHFYDLSGIIISYWNITDAFSFQEADMIWKAQESEKQRMPIHDLSLKSSDKIMSSYQLRISHRASEQSLDSLLPVEEHYYTTLSERQFQKYRSLSLK